MRKRCITAMTKMSHIRQTSNRADLTQITSSFERRQDDKQSIASIIGIVQKMLPYIVQKHYRDTNKDDHWLYKSRR